MGSDDLRERWLAGESLRDLAKEHGVTRERMRQLVMAAAPCSSEGVGGREVQR